MSKKRVTMWVDPDFRKAIKKKAADEGKDICSMTREMAKDLDMQLPAKPKKKNDFGFF